MTEGEEISFKEQGKAPELSFKEQGKAPELSFKEQRIRQITNLYYSKPEVQEAIFNFAKNREVCPVYFKGFGKRPDTLEYKGDIVELVKKGATSFHCSEELWKNPLEIETGMSEKAASDLRIGWDFVIDIDCKWFDYSKLAAKAIISTLEKYQVKNMGIKFSGGKGFHIIVPWKAFPKEMNGIETAQMFPELPRKIIGFIRFEAEKILKQTLPEDFYEQFKNVQMKRGIKCNKCREVAREYEIVSFFCDKCRSGEEKKREIGERQPLKCPTCRGFFYEKQSDKIYECPKCGINSKKNPLNFSRNIEEDLFELMGLDLVLVSPRHLFRMPYSLHEKTALASVVIDVKEIDKFELKDADPLKVKVKDFMPSSREGEATELLREALDWHNQKIIGKGEKKIFNSEQIKVTDFSEKNFPPCVRNILKGIDKDGKKRALFVLINIFRSSGMEKEEIEKRIYEWDKKNKPLLGEVYIKPQLSWNFKRKPLLPPNCKEFYQGIGVCTPDEFCSKIKNPLNYLIRKASNLNKRISFNKTKFKNNL